jgi:hypothetical protein
MMVYAQKAYAISRHRTEAYRMSTAAGEIARRSRAHLKMPLANNRNLEEDARKIKSTPGCGNRALSGAEKRSERKQPFDAKSAPSTADDKAGANDKGLGTRIATSHEGRGCVAPRPKGPLQSVNPA